MTPPVWPRLMDEAVAAAYLSRPVETMKRVRVGRLKFEGRLNWDRIVLDRHLDQLAGIVPPATPAPANDGAPLEDSPSAALDRFLADQRHAPGRP